MGKVEDVEEDGKAELKNKKHLYHLTLNLKQVGMKEVVEALQSHPSLKSLSIAWYQVS